MGARLTTDVTGAPRGGEAEQALWRRWRDHHDISAAQQLAGSHWYLVVETALGYWGFGLDPEELIGEGYVGLMRAVCRFDPDRDMRFDVYALWCVRAVIHECILRNWSLVTKELGAPWIWLPDDDRDAIAPESDSARLRVREPNRPHWEVQHVT